MAAFLKNASIKNNISTSNSDTKPRKGDSFSQLFQEEIKISSNAHLLTCENVNSIQDIIDIEKFSSYKKLLRVKSWVFRIIRNDSKKKDRNSLPYIRADELEEPKLLWLRVNQLDIKLNDNFKDLENSVRLRLDDNGLYRSAGRFSQGKGFPVLKSQYY